MPALSSNRVIPLNSDVDGPSKDEFAQILKTLADDLEAEVCNALLNEDVKLAERLKLQSSRTKKLMNSIKSSAVDFV